MPALDPQTIAPIALAAAAAWLLFGDRIRSVGSNWGRIGSGNASGGDLQSLVAAADLLIKHFDAANDSEGSQAARTAAGRLFAAKPKPFSFEKFAMESGQAPISRHAETEAKP